MSADSYTCPICGLPMGEGGTDDIKLHPHMTDGMRRVVQERGILVCEKGHTVTLAKYAWEVLGIGVSNLKELRCPYCSKMFAEGDYSDRTQTFKCRGCKKRSIFLRI